MARYQVGMIYYVVVEGVKKSDRSARMAARKMCEDKKYPGDPFWVDGVPDDTPIGLVEE
jgi:hypothetical protein